MIRLATFAAVIATSGALSVPLRAQRPAAPAPAAGVTTPLRVERSRENSYRFRLLGVYDAASGEPLAGVDVTDILSGLHAATTATGTVSLFFLPDGGSLVRLRKVGYAVETIPVSIAPADTTPITLTLTHVNELDTVMVRADSAPHYLSPGLRGFEERASHHLGHFIGEAELRKSDNQQLGTMLAARLPGIMMRNDARDPRAIRLVSARKMCSGPVLSGCSTPSCFVSVFVDGIKVYPGGPLPDFAQLSVQDYGAIEFYQTAETPPEFSEPGGDCGTLVLWSRER